MEKQAKIVNRKIPPYAEQLIKNKPRLVYADKILFDANNKSGGIKKNKTLAKTSKIPPKRTEILYQFGACEHFYIIEIYAKRYYLDRPRHDLFDGNADWKKLLMTYYEEAREAAKR